MKQFCCVRWFQSVATSTWRVDPKTSRQRRTNWSQKLPVAVASFDAGRAVVVGGGGVVVVVDDGEYSDRGEGGGGSGDGGGGGRVGEGLGGGCFEGTFAHLVACNPLFRLLCTQSLVH